MRFAKRNAHLARAHERTIGACEAPCQSGRHGSYAAPHRGYDISNTQGVLSVASMVVAIDGEAAKKEYRIFRIKTVEGANDFASMYEVITRRLTRATQRAKHLRRKENCLRTGKGLQALPICPI